MTRKYDSTDNAMAKRTKGEREIDLIAIAEMYLKGETYQSIATQISAQRDYSISRSTVFNDLQVLQARWKESQLVDFDEAKAKELTRIDKLEAEYWFAWSRSLRQSEEILTERIQDNLQNQGNAGIGHVREKVKKREITTYGDPRYLQGVQWCIDRRCKIFGLDAPKQVDINWRDEARLAGYDPDQLETGLVQEFVDAAKQGKTMIIVDDDSDSKQEQENVDE